MARNTTLANATTMLKGELGISQASGVQTATDTELYTLIDNRQKWLSSEYDWPFLKERVDITVPAGTGDSSRYHTLPTTLNFERPVVVTSAYQTFWHPVEFGISELDYNSIPSGDGGTTARQMDPIQRWDWKAGDKTKIEVWPLPSTQQTLRFEGQKVLTDLKNGGASYVTSQQLDLDDLLVVLFASATWLARMKKQDAKLKLAEAQNRLNYLRSSYPSRTNSFVMGSGRSDGRPIKKAVPIKLVGV